MEMDSTHSKSKLRGQTPEINDLWREIAKRGTIAIPLKKASLSLLEWAEVEDMYPELVPESCRNYHVQGSRQLLRESPFVKAPGKDGAYGFYDATDQAFFFRAWDPLSGQEIKTCIDCDELVRRMGLETWFDSGESSSEGILTCSCGYPGCAGVSWQSFHVSREMIHWSVLYEGSWMELFFDRQPYEKGAIRMLREMVEHPGSYVVPYGQRYEEDHEGFVANVEAMLQRWPQFRFLWDEEGPV